MFLQHRLAKRGIMDRPASQHRCDDGVNRRLNRTINGRKWEAGDTMVGLNF